MKCCFTGHRNVIITDELTKKLENEIIYLINSGVTEFYNGGAVGWDLLCGKIVLKLRKTYPIKLNIILPCNEELFTSKWDSTNKNELKNLLSIADNIEIISDHYSTDCIKKRNLQLVNKSDYCICFYNKTRFRCGTGQTVRMAEKKGISIINLY